MTLKTILNTPLHVFHLMGSKKGLFRSLSIYMVFGETRGIKSYCQFSSLFFQFSMFSCNGMREGLTTGDMSYVDQSQRTKKLRFFRILTPERPEMTIFKIFFAKPRSFSHYLGSIYPIGEVSAKKKFSISGWTHYFDLNLAINVLIFSAETI